MKKLFLVLLILSSVVVKLTYDFFPIKYYNDVVEVSKEQRIDPIIILAMIRVESNFREKIVSPKGAVGLMQVMPKTAEWILEKNGLVPKNYDLYTARDNIIIGTLYYKYLSKKFDGNLEKIMAAYNGGSVRVRNNTWRNVTETSNYVKRIDWAMKAYEYKLPIYLKIKEFL